MGRSNINNGKRLGVIADIHSNIHALEAVLEELKDLPLVCAGDIVGFCANPNEVFQSLLNRKILCSRGDHDYAIAAKRPATLDPASAYIAKWTAKKLCTDYFRFLEELPTSINFSMGKYKICVTHGSPRSITEYVLSTDPEDCLREYVRMTKADLLILGHTHIPMIKEIDGTLIINPGSIGAPRDCNPKPSFIVVDFTSEGINVEHCRVEYDLEAAVQSMNEARLPRTAIASLKFGC